MFQSRKYLEDYVLKPNAPKNSKNPDDYIYVGQYYTLQGSAQFTPRKIEIIYLSAAILEFILLILSNLANNSSGGWAFVMIPYGTSFFCSCVTVSGVLLLLTSPVEFNQMVLERGAQKVRNSQLCNFIILIICAVFHIGWVLFHEHTLISNDILFLTGILLDAVLSAFFWRFAEKHMPPKTARELDYDFSLEDCHNEL